MTLRVSHSRAKKNIIEWFHNFRCRESETNRFFDLCLGEKNVRLKLNVKQREVGGQKVDNICLRMVNRLEKLKI